jgi:hypothetical protein
VQLCSTVSQSQRYEKFNLDRETTYDLILSHGRSDIYLHYATIVGDHDKVIDHWIGEEDWLRAIGVLSRQVGLSLICSSAEAINTTAESRIILRIFCHAAQQLHKRNNRCVDQTAIARSYPFTSCSVDNDGRKRCW